MLPPLQEDLIQILFKRFYSLQQEQSISLIAKLRNGKVNIKLKLLSLIFLSSSILIANNYQNRLIIPSTNIEHPFWEFAGQTISQREDDAFAELVEKWSDILHMLYLQLNNKIYEDIGASIPQLDFYMEDQRFIDLYTNYCKKIYLEDLEDEEIDPVIANFIHSKLYYLQCNKPVKVYVQENIPQLAVSFGADKAMHFIIFNKNIYNREKINSLYQDEIDNKSQFYIMPSMNNHQSRAIEHSNFLHFGITQTLSDIAHQGDYFSKLLLFFLYNQKTMSKEIQSYGAEFVLFRTYLECCFQSKNPLEIALFLEPYLDSFSQEFILLWRELIEDTKNCYDVDDLEAYEALSLKKRRESLYTIQDEDNDE